MRKRPQANKITKNITKSVVWEGPQFGFHSVALLNREFCLKLFNSKYDLSIIGHGRQPFGTETDNCYHELSAKFNKKLKMPADIHVRHQRQPNLNPPPEGRWVIMQHWEFGSLPKAWIEPMRQVLEY